MAGVMQAVSAPVAGGRVGLGLLLVRLVAGPAMMLHGWPKMQNPFGWMGPEAPVPGVLQALAAVSEFGGGLAWLAGALMPLASLGILCTMIGAVLFHVNRGDPFVAAGGPSYELASLYLVLSVVFLVVGPGHLSADASLFLKQQRNRLA